MMESLESLLNQFRDKGLKITPQRRVILEALAQDASHPTADEVYQRVQATMPDVTRATVYNTLRALIEVGALAEVHGLRQGSLRYDTNNATHHHLFCTQCHTLIDIARDFEGLHLTDEEIAGYKIVRHQITFYGICPDCQARNDSPA